MIKTSTSVIAVGIFIGALLLRYTTLHSPFWVDEFSTAEQAKLVLEYGISVFTQSSNYFESNNILTHFITAISFSFLEVGEWQARVPMMVIGSLVPVAMYFLARSLLNSSTAVIGALLYTFSYLQISWARQARGYVLSQLMVVLFLFFYASLLKKFTKTKFTLLIITIILGVLTHTTFLLVLIIPCIHLIISYKKIGLHKFKKIVAFISVGILLSGVMLITGQASSVYANTLEWMVHIPNNLAYYHSFLWREQTVLSIFAFLGSLILIFKMKQYFTALLLVVPIFIYVGFFSFVFSPYVSRYLLPVFPLLYILSGLTISELGTHISKKYGIFLSLLILIFILFNGDKYVLKGKSYYSVNHDMREIALLDYDRVYDLIASKSDLSRDTTAVIDTWPDRMKWYLGDNQQYFYVFRWADGEGTLNGIVKATPYELNDEEEKYIPKTGRPEIRLISNSSDLQNVMQKYPSGFIWIDDSTLPADVIDYAQTHLKKELYLDHYPLDDNPYSIWPGTLYSWGVDS